MEYGPTTALIVVDVQNDFADPKGNLSVAGGEDVIDFINEQIKAASRAGATVVYTQDWHPESTPHFDVEGGIWPVHCVADTPGAELHPALEVIEGAVRVKKGVGGEDGYSAFNVRDPETGNETSTGLASQLRNSGIERIVVLGLALDYCVRESAVDAASAGFETTLLADGTRPVNLMVGDGVRAVASLIEAGVAVE
ncbi:MAG: isochorismatase family protein [Acidimicrobiia bacterium]